MEPTSEVIQRVAFFGGSFNPPHIAHLLAVTYALATAPIDKVIVVPVFQHPFAKELAPYADRFTMCERAMAWIPGVSISRIEEDLGGESRTLRTLEHLAGAHPSWRLRLLIGADVVSDAPKWHRFDRVVEIAPPIVLGRAGAEITSASEPVLPSVSSTEIRAALRAGDIEKVRPLLPSSVLEFIESRRLYSGT